MQQRKLGKYYLEKKSYKFKEIECFMEYTIETVLIANEQTS